jgi:HK97 family phage prohead protease
MPVYSCGDGTYRIGDGPCKYTSRESAISAYVAYLAQEDDDNNKKHNTMIYGYKSFANSIKDIDTKQGIVTGYFSAFDIKDSDGDIIRKGAFKKSIEDWFPKGRIKHLLNHDPSKPLGVLKVLNEDNYGLYYESKIGKHNLAQDFLKMVESDIVKEHSIGFSIVRQQKGQEANELVDLKLFEGSSLTAWGANEHTPIMGMKSTVEIRDRIKTFEKFVRNTDATDEAIEMCLLEIKQLYQVLETLSSKQVADEAPVEQKSEHDLLDAINLITLKHF